MAGTETLKRERNPLFKGWCYLCGTPVHPKAWYCAAHRWAGRYQ